LKCNILIISLLLLFKSLSGNEFLKSRHFFVQPAYHTGFIPDPNYLHQDLINGFTRSIHLSMGIQTNGNKKWHKYYFLSNDKQLGRMTALVPFIQIKPVNQRAIYPSASFGIGLAYNNKPYHRIENHHNQLIGSHLNASIIGGFDLNIKIYSNLHALAGVSFAHFSNGNTKVPNRSINILKLNAGLKYLFNDIAPEYNNHEDFKKYEFSLACGFSVTDRKNGLYKGYHYYDVMLEAARKFNPAMGIGLGLDITFNDADTSNSYYNWYFPEQRIQKGLKIFSQFTFSRLEMLFSFGYELKASPALYDQIILRYKIINSIKFNMLYKSYLLFGDHLSWGVCFTL